VTWSGPSGMDAARARTLGYLVSFQVTRRRRNRSGVSQSRISRAAITWRIQISSCTRNPVEAVRQPGPRSDDRGRSAAHLQLINRYRPNRGPYRRDLRRLPQGSRKTPKAALAFDLASKRASVQTTQIATWVQAERRRRGVGRAAWMPREPPPAMDGGWRRAHGASPE
jgi:hypothetical protein